MDSQKPVDSETYLTHKRQFIWHILVPFLVVTALILALAVLTAAGNTSFTRTWADISIIWLIIPLLIFAIIFVVVIGSLIYGVAKLLRVTPKYTAKAQVFAAVVASGTRKVADGASRPILWVQQAVAVLKSIFKLS